MVTGNQIRIARFALRWSVQDLSEVSGVSVRTLKRIEAEDGVPSSSASSIHSLRECLEAAGIEFIGTPDDGPGIRIHKRSSLQKGAEPGRDVDADERSRL